MNTELVQRGAEIERKLIQNIASCDTLTLNQCIALIYGGVTAGGMAAMQRKLKAMMQNKTIGREKSGDGLYRYYLLEGGVRVASEYANFSIRSGTDRSYLNSSRRDAVIDALISDSHEIEGCQIAGPGALRVSGKYTDFDGAVFVRDERGGRFVKLYIQVHTPTPANVERYERAVRQAKAMKIPLTLIAEKFTRKLLGLKN